MRSSLAGQLAVNSAITLDLTRSAAASRFRHQASGPLRGLPGETRLFVAALGTSGRSKALRIDLFRFEVSRAPADAATDGPAKTFPSSVVRIGVTEGAMSESKAVGITMRLAPNVVIESRIGPHRESDTTIRFTLHF